MPATVAPRRQTLPPLCPQDEFAGTLPSGPRRVGPLRSWLFRFVGCEAGMLLPGRGAARKAAVTRPGQRRVS